MSKQVEPINGNVILKKIDQSEQTYGQIVIPDMGKERPEMCEVVQTSETYNWHKGVFVASGLELGNVVLIPKMGAMSFSVDSEDYIVIKETDILAIIK